VKLETMHLDSQFIRNSRPAKILVVDDDPDIRSLTRTFLEHEGHVVYVSGDADRAAKIFSRASDIDLVITDYSMPQRSGFDLARELKKIRPSLRVLIISGVVLSSGQLDQMKVYGWNFLPKPFSLPDLLTQIYKILESVPRSESSATLIA
jgi:DNA-binding NtrC family response regulator